MIPDKKYKIFNYLKANKKNRYMIIELARILNIDRHTCSGYLKVLESEDKITFKQVGIYKLYSYKIQRRI